jgi:hypothetical protein
VAEGGEKDLELEFVRTEILPLLGDYNVDGVVDAVDYTVWRNAMGTLIDLPNEGHGQGVVTTGDYQVWKNQYGQQSGVNATIMSGIVRYVTAAGSGGLATAVPEPFGLTMLLLGCGGLAPARLRRGGRSANRGPANS